MDNRSKYQAFCCDLQKEYLDRLSGEGEANAIIYDSLPSDKLVIGILDSGVDINNRATFARTMPIAKVQFYSDLEPTGSMEITLSGNLYYNVLPTYDEEMAYIKSLKEEHQVVSDGANSETAEDVNMDDPEPHKLRFRKKYKRVQLADIIPTIKISKSDLLAKGMLDISDQVNSILASKDLFSDAIFYATDRCIMLKSIESQAQYEDYIATHSFSNGCQIIKAALKWKFEVLVSCEPIAEDKCVITVSIENKTEKPSNCTNRTTERRFMDTKYAIPVYNVGIKAVGTDGFRFCDISLRNFVESYKIDSEIKAQGEWLTAKFDAEQNSIVTENTPIYKEYRIITKDKYDNLITFEKLQKDPDSSLKQILNDMKAYYEQIQNRP